jgi:hypothetical protein
MPWIAYMAYSLPSRQVLADYDIAWAGFDVMLLVALASTGYFALRRSRYLATAATAAAALLVVDAWFEVVTTLPGQRLEPIALAAGVELPLASVCVWLSRHTQELTERGWSCCCAAAGRRKRAAADCILAVTRTFLPERAPAGCPAPG